LQAVPQLVGKAQQAYAGLSVTDASDYDQLKSAILQRYDITEESYDQCFRSAKPRPGVGFFRRDGLLYRLWINLDVTRR